MGQALYRKYRSMSLSEIVGQEHITDTLTKALASGRISHAYLFSGPRGVGKTSIARILAHEINGLPYSDSSSHLDIIEIDAASNNGVEDVRDLREKVFVAPTSSKYKVYIIDEVHMLSKAAFNALLKTLEEPPAHVVFILATTEAHKLPDTIISRTQHYTFRPVEQAKVIEHLRHIATEENVLIDDEALAVLASHGEGSFRDSISVLDQAQSLSSITKAGASIGAADVRQLLGIAPEEAIVSLISSVGQAGRAGALLTEISGLYAQGLQAANIASQLGEKLRSALAHGKSQLPIGQALSLMKQLIEVPAARNPERLLEIVLLESAEAGHASEAVPHGDTARAATTAAQPKPDISAPTVIHKPQAAVEPPHQSVPEPALKSASTKADTAKTRHAAAGNKQEPSDYLASTPITDEKIGGPPAIAGPSSAVTLNAAIWSDILNNIKKEYNTLYGVLRMANPIFNGEGIELQFKFAFHQKRLNEVKNKQIIADFIRRSTGSDVVVLCTYNKDATPGVSPVAASVPASAGLETISNIFGGGEVLDS
jgi:DNA polymerase-3 subunit gamma/tau